jgi:DNA-directed RNA polymerase specialized sigma24 family protein
VPLPRPRWYLARLGDNLSAVKVESSESDQRGLTPFPETIWSAILQAKNKEGEASLAAMNRLCQLYLPAVRQFLIQKGIPAHEAEELLQSFFTKKFLHAQFLANVGPGAGRFRTFIKECLRRFLASEHARGVTWAEALSFDDSTSGLVETCPANGVSPDLLMDRLWAVQVLTTARARLEAEAQSAGRERFCQAIMLILDEDSKAPSHAQVAAQLGMTENAVAVGAHRFRERLRWFIQDEVRQTVANPADWREELDHLVAALRV